MWQIKQSTAIEVHFFAHDASGNFVPSIADGSWTKRIIKSGASPANMTVTITELEGGLYKMTLSSAHTDTLGVLTIQLSATGVQRVNLQYLVRVRTVDDAVTLSSGSIQAIWDALTSALTTVGSIGKRLVDNLDAAVSSRSTLTEADVKTEIDAALDTDTCSELSQAQPPATPTIRQALMLPYMVSRNKRTVDANEEAVFNDAGTKVAKATITDDGTTVTRDKFISGA